MMTDKERALADYYATKAAEVLRPLLYYIAEMIREQIHDEINHSNR